MSRRIRKGARIHDPISGRSLVAQTAAAVLAPLGLVVSDAEPELELELEVELDPPVPPAPKTLSLQPTPIDWMAQDVSIGKQKVTAIAREWEPGDEQRCFLCDPDRCIARRRGIPRCIVNVPCEVSDVEAPLFDLAAFMERTGIR
jgi:hypothetical protein